MTLETYLRKHRLSDQAFSERVGCTQSYVSRLKRGIVSPSLSIALKVRSASNDEIELVSLLPIHERPKDEEEEEDMDAFLRRMETEDPRGYLEHLEHEVGSTYVELRKEMIDIGLKIGTLMQSPLTPKDEAIMRMIVGWCRNQDAAEFLETGKMIIAAAESRRPD